MQQLELVQNVFRRCELVLVGDLPRGRQSLTIVAQGHDMGRCSYHRIASKPFMSKIIFTIKNYYVCTTLCYYYYYASEDKLIFGASLNN